MQKPVTVGELAEFLKAEVLGDPARQVLGLNEIHKVVPGDLTFTDIPKYYRKSLGSAASVILINSRVAVPEGKSLIYSGDPFSDFNKLTILLTRPESPAFYSDDEDDDSPAHGNHTTWGEDCVFHPGVVLGNNCTLGSNVTLFPNVVLYDNTVIGNDVTIHAGSIIGAHAFYFKRRPTHFEKLISSGRVVIEDGVEIGALCTIDKGVSGDTIIGEGSKLDNHIHLGHGVVIGKRCLIAAQVGIGGKTVVEDEVIIWGQAGLTKDITIGARAVIAAQSGVSKSLPGGQTYFGTPAKPIFAAHRAMVKDRADKSAE